MSQATASGATPRVSESPTPGNIPPGNIPSGNVSSGNVPLGNAPIGRARSRASRRLLRGVLMLGGIALVVIGAPIAWLHGGRYVSIDNAYVRAAKLSLSTDVSGIIADIPVKEDQRVRQGDVLLRLDKRKFQIALEGAEATLAQTVLTIDSMKRDYQRMLRDIEVRRAQLANDQTVLDRAASLVESGASTRAQYDAARFAVQADLAAVEASKTQAEVQLAKLGNNPDIDPKDAPLYKQALAQVDEAKRELEHSVIRAPFDGIVTMVDTAQPGMYLAAATAAFGIVSTQNVWIEANPKETEITHVHIGDKATVTVDTYPDRVWKGTVCAISPNSGGEFAILPAQNTSGNWVKVVQRIPLRVCIQRQKDDPDLRTGMSSVVSIDTGHKRTLSDLWPG